MYALVCTHMTASTYLLLWVDFFVWSLLFIHCGYTAASAGNKIKSYFRSMLTLWKIGGENHTCMVPICVSFSSLDLSWPRYWQWLLTLQFYSLKILEDFANIVKLYTGPFCSLMERRGGVQARIAVRGMFIPLLNHFSRFSLYDNHIGLQYLNIWIGNTKIKTSTRLYWHSDILSKLRLWKPR